MTKNANDTTDLAPIFAELAFPLAVLAMSPRASAFIIMQRPFHIARKLHRLTPTATRRQMIQERFQSMLAALEPRILLHVNGTCWSFDATPAPKVVGAIATTVRDACAFLGCSPTRTTVISRILDAYPEFESPLRPILRSRRRDDRVRAMQPLLAAMIVAHAASVAHILRYG